MTETIGNAAHVLLLPGAKFQRSAAEFKKCFRTGKSIFTSYNILTIAALVANGDMLAIIPSRFYMFSRCWPLEKLPFPS